MKGSVWPERGVSITGISNIKMASVLIELDSSMRTKQAKIKKDHLDFNLIVAPEYKNITIKTDKNKFIKIFTCLLSNAFAFTEEGYINYGYNLFQ